MHSYSSHLNYINNIDSWWLTPSQWAVIIAGLALMTACIVYFRYRVNINEQKANTHDLKKIAEQDAEIANDVADDDEAESASTTPDTELSEHNQRFIDAIMKFLNKNIENPDLNVELLAAEMGLSRSQLHRRIKEITGKSCGEFIRNFRLEQTAHLLATNADYSVTDVAFACGFTNPTNFATTFKKRYGVTPSKYALAHRE